MPECVKKIKVGEYPGEPSKNPCPSSLDIVDEDENRLMNSI